MAPILRVASAERIPVTVRALGSSVTGQPLPVNGGIVLDVSAVPASYELDEVNLTVRVTASHNGGVLEDALQALGLTLGHSPQSLYRSTVGGWLATLATGQFSSLYGGIEDLVVGYTVVLASGDTVELNASPRAAMGPDLRQLFIGSEGTLGVITSVTLKVFRLPQTQLVQTFAMPSVRAGLGFLREQAALVTDPASRTRIVCSTLTAAQVHRSLEFAREAGLDAVVWTPDHMLAERRSAGTDLLEDVNQERVLIGPIDQSRFSRTVKVMLSAPQETLDRIAPRVRQELPFMQRSMSRFFESSNPGATKKEALRLVLGRLGIPASFCVGLADGDTDADWLAEIGTAVAVSNAMESVQAIADVRIGHHDDDAVAEFLELGIRWLEAAARCRSH